MKRYGLTRVNGDLDYLAGNAGVIVPLFDRFGASTTISGMASFEAAIGQMEPIGRGTYRVARCHAQLITASPTSSCIVAIINAKVEPLIAAAAAAYGAQTDTPAAAPWFDWLNDHSRFPWVRIIGTDGDHEGYEGGEFKITEAGWPVLLRGSQGDAVVANDEATVLLEIEPIG